MYTAGLDNLLLKQKAKPSAVVSVLCAPDERLSSLSFTLRPT